MDKILFTLFFVLVVFMGSFFLWSVLTDPCEECEWPDCDNCPFPKCKRK